jgi:carboxyl-terminal processing protease
MKVLRGDYCTHKLAKKVLPTLIFLLFLPSFFIFPCSASEIGCDQFLKLFGLAFGSHRIEFSSDQILSIYQQSLSLTMSQLDPENKIFAKEEAQWITIGITKERFGLCANLKEIETIYNQRSGKTLSSARIFEIELQNLLSRMDPHSNFFTKKSWKEFLSQIQGKTEGIGINFNTEQGYPVVTKVIKNGPSENVLLAGDAIVEIAGKQTKGLSNDAVKEILKSLPSGIVELSVKRYKEVLTLEVEKREFRIPSVEWRFLNKEQRIVYLVLSEFSDQSSKEMEDALQEASKTGRIRGLIIDLRYNPGGYVKEAQKIATMFLESPIIGSVVRRDDKKDIPALEQSGAFSEKEAPIIILLNNFSASASELFSISIKDMQRGVIIGKNSFGKGTGQDVLEPKLLSKELSEEFEVAITLTTFQFYSPLGNSPQRDGVGPDLIVADPDLDKKIAQKRESAKARGIQFIARESDYDNALQPNKNPSSLNLFNYPSNKIGAIVNSISEELNNKIIVSGSEMDVDIAKTDPQLSKAINFINVYADNCDSYHINSCHFTGGPYASR